MASLAEVWSLLRSVRALRFDARSAAATGWNGSGTGTVQVSEPEPGVVIFDEAGTWQPLGGAAVRFTNVFRWSNTGEALRLEHLRFGPEEPVFLFLLAADAGGAWHAVSPHLCREDCYTASLAFAGRQLLMAWSIRGPRKRELIQYVHW
jgi:hypothetical protein